MSTMRKCPILHLFKWISLIAQCNLKTFSMSSRISLIAQCNLKTFSMSSMAFQVHQALLVPRGLLVLQAPYCLIIQSWYRTSKPN